MTNIPAAIKSAYTDIFTPSTGDRQNVSNVMIVVFAHDASKDLKNIMQEAHAAETKWIHVVAVGKTLCKCVIVNNSIQFLPL